ncbi:MAG: DUF2027 domain-containing protein [Lentimicrobiaceae bacterium]|nr:DUF2027 domain-containing protein [Lentimicrobiaceae bacterium]
MELKPGDKVRFLNEKAEGVVTRILNNVMVNVAIEDGFEVPVMVNELVKIDHGGAAGRYFGGPPAPGTDFNVKETHKPAHPAASAPEANTNEPERLSNLYRQSGKDTAEGIYLMFMPHNQQQLIMGNLDIYLVNNTNAELLFTLAIKDEDKLFSGLQYEVIPPFQKLLLETIDRDDINYRSQGVIQGLFFREERAALPKPLDAEFNIRPVRFYKENSYGEFKLTGGKGIVIKLDDPSAQAAFQTREELSRAGVEPALQRKVTAIAPPAFIDEYQTDTGEAEVDLHISALRDDYPKMNKGEILHYQLNYFSRMLDSAITNHYRKVTFIHGIGNGTLKAAIVSKLNDYENIEVRNAPFAKFGNGAIDVIIHQKQA